MDIYHLRQEYSEIGLDRSSLLDSPIEQFSLWFRQATESELPEPNAMGLATVSAENRPALRTVLLKSYDEQGFMFFTNYESNKAKEMAHNPNVALLFLWTELSRQVRIEGQVSKLSTAESLKYFATRPRGSQLGAWSSPQSSIITSRSLLQAKWAEVRQKFENKEVPIPSFWGGYRVVPQRIEFWKGRRDRLHDRFLYQLQPDNTWSIERLAP